MTNVPNSAELIATENQKHILYLIGLYISHWSSFELALDCATVKVMNVSPADVIALTGGQTVAKKINFFKQQLALTGHASQSVAGTLAASLQADSIRNSIVHSYHEYGKQNGVTFIHRKSRVNVLVKKYTTSEFVLHLQHVSTLAFSLSKEFGETETESRAFIEAAKL